VFGTLPSMKNQRRIVLNKRTGKPFSIKSKAAEEYEITFLHQIRQKVPQEPLTGDLSIKVRVLYPNRRFDLDIEFLCDLLQKAGVVQNDRCFIHKESWKGYDKFIHKESWKGYDKENPRVVFSIYPAKAGCCAG
jgi:Holliday junction resolvase RusA-like endonuclease